MMQITLAGELGRRFGKTYKLAVRSPNEAIRALCHKIPGFRAYLTGAHEFGVYFQILTEHSEDGINYEDLGFGCSEFTLVPMITGALFGGGKGGAIASILIGIALVAFAFTGFGVVAFGGVGTISASIQTAVAALGFGLIFNGIAALFAPGAPQQGKNEGADADQAIFGGAPPPVANGSVVPLLYGEYLVTNAPVVSSYIDDNEGYWMGLISEGEIEGFPTSADKDLYLNGLAAEVSPLEELQLTDGTQNSAVIDLVKSAGFHIPVGATLNFQGGEYEDDDNGDPNTSVTRSFSQTRADKVIVRLSVGPCYQQRQRATGGGSGSNFRDYTEDDDSGGADNPTRMVIELRDGDGALIGRDDETFILNSGTILYTKEFDLSNEVMPVSVTVTRVDRKGPRDPVTKTGDTSQRTYTWVKSPVTFSSVDVIWNERLVYPHSALLALKFRTGEFTEIPRIQARMKGIKVPTLSSSLRVSYAWSNNPAYILLDLLTNPRYGAGFRRYNTTGGASREVTQPGIRMQDIDLGSFREAANYCEDNNITFNGYINRDSEAVDLFRGICSVMQAQIIYAGGFITLVVDKEVTDIRNYRLYSPANTIQETDSDGAAPCFSYEGTSRKARSTAVEVSYVNPDQFYREEKVLEENVEAIERYGYNLVRIRALGCTNRGSARRMARYTLASNVLSTETVSFKVGPDGAMVIPGDICLINDSLKTGLDLGGRITSVDSGGIIVDRDLPNRNFDNGNWYLYTYGRSGITQRHAISSADSSQRSIRISGSWDNQPQAMNMWAIANENKDVPEFFPQYRVQSIKEGNDGIYEIVAIRYNREKFDYMEDGELDIPVYSARFFRGEVTGLQASSISFQVRTPDTPQPQPAEQPELEGINGGSALSDFD